MKPIEFPEQNTIYAKDQSEYIPLPALVKPNPEGEVVSCWQLSFRERVKLLFTGKVWMSLWMFRDSEGNVRPLTPSRLTVNAKDILE